MIYNAGFSLAVAMFGLWAVFEAMGHGRFDDFPIANWHSVRFPEGKSCYHSPHDQWIGSRENRNWKPSIFPFNTWSSWQFPRNQSIDMMCNKQISDCLEWLQSAQRNSPAIVMLEIACQATTGPNLAGNHSTVYKCAFLPAFVLTVDGRNPAPPWMVETL